MKWVKFRIKTVTEAEDIIISTLYDLGLEGAQIEDKVPLTAMEKEQMFVDILPDGPEDDGIAYLSFFVEEKEDGSLEVAGEKTTTEAVLADVKRELEDLRQFMDIGEGSVAVDETEDIDWINNWKQYFHQFYIDDILVIPSWENIKPEDTDKMVLHIDPGTAFGTGMHETTQLCIRQLRKFITSETELLDVGTGSGILAILSLMFGAKHAVGTDLDICAVEAVAQNCDVNGIDPAQFDMMIGNIITDKEVQDKVGYECYDIVVANILADVLVPLTPVIVHQLKKGGIYITSGIIDDKEQTVVEAVKAAGLEVLEVTYQGEWVSVTARKNLRIFNNVSVFCRAGSDRCGRKKCHHPGSRCQSYQKCTAYASRRGSGGQQRNRRERISLWDPCTGGGLRPSGTAFYQRGRRGTSGEDLSVPGAAQGR